MAINKENYPEYFLDFFEGRLSEKDKVDLFVFLDEHPALKKDFETFDLVGLDSDPVWFPAKESLKRGKITTANYEWYFAAYVEGDLSEDERTAVEAFASMNDGMGRELRLMQLAFLNTDNVLAFPGKAALKHHVMSITESLTEGKGDYDITVATSASGTADSSSHKPSVSRERWLYIPKLWYYMSAAAVVLWLAGLFFLRTPDPEINNLVSDLPAVEEADEPKAVAEIPSPTGRSVETETRQEHHHVARLDDIRITEPSITGQGTESPYDHSPVQQHIQMVTHGLAELQPINTRQPVLQPEHGRPDAVYSTMEYKTEFAFWSQSLLPSTYYTEEEYGLIAQQDTEETNLTQLAFSSLQKTLPVDFSKVDDHISQGRIPLRQLAERGLAELGVIATNALGIERETDDQGRTLAIRAGNAFEARRSSR
jgi:hypothetical protein